MVFDSPHSGLDYPPDFEPVASRAAILTTWDAYVDELWGGVPAAGATLLTALFPRAYVDANRAANDIDPEVLDAPWPHATVRSDYTRRGMGLIRRFAEPDVPMYARPLSIAAVKHRIGRYHEPYRRALRETLDAVGRRQGVVWHFNCHSMKSGNGRSNGAAAKRPDVTIGDRDGATASPRVTDWVAKFFRDRGYTVAINHPYRGGDIVRTQGDPARGRHSIQIEINRALYMDEATCERGPRFGALRAELTAFAHAAADFGKSFTANNR
ncbi:MAG TPA: N-formylglutamate amidohydrolase [Opitutaceae bacterium]|nr:N-formylglutamate amidohydrolase [Opitutaceae bacterium]